MPAVYAPINLSHVENQDSSTSFDSPILDLTKPIKSVQYQISWDANVLGVFKFLATIFPDKWEEIPSCNIEVYTSGDTEGHKIVFIPEAWLMCSKLKYVWEPSAGSSGNINTAIRIATI